MPSIEEYQRKLITSEEAANLIQSGDKVLIPAASAPLSLVLALVARKEELRNIQISLGVPLQDYPWFEPGWEQSFQIEVWFVNHPVVRELINKHKSADYRICPASLLVKGVSERELETKRADFVLVDMSTPDNDGYCSFDTALWDKKEQIQHAKKVIAETHPSYVRTYGDNFIHVSEIDYFAKHTPSGKQPGSTDLLGRKTQLRRIVSRSGTCLGGRLRAFRRLVRNR